MFVIAARALRAAGVEAIPIRGPLVFKDANQLSGFAVSEVLQLNEANLIDGNGSRKLLPKANTTRAEAAIIVNRLMEFQFHP